MASLYITGFSRMAAGGSHPQMAQQPATEAQKLAIGAETKSAAFNANTRIVRVHTDAICSIKFVTVDSDAATTSDERLAANQTEYYAIPPEVASMKISVISNT